MWVNWRRKKIFMVSYTWIFEEVKGFHDLSFKYLKAKVSDTWWDSPIVIILYVDVQMRVGIYEPIVMLVFMYLNYLWIMSWDPVPERPSLLPPKSFFRNFSGDWHSRCCMIDTYKSLLRCNFNVHHPSFLHHATWFADLSDLRSRYPGTLSLNKGKKHSFLHSKEEERNFP